MPLTIRMPYGGGVRAPELHRGFTGGVLRPHPGIKVAVPSTQRMRRACSPLRFVTLNPVVFFEPKALYRNDRESIPEGEHLVPLGHARTVRDGSEASIVAYGAMVRVAEAAADTSPAEGISVLVQDVRTLRPLDEALCWRLRGAPGAS